MMRPSRRGTCRNIGAIFFGAVLCLRPASDHLFVIRASWPLDSRGPSRTLLGAKAKDLDAAARANRANQMNPNYPSHRKKKGPATAAGSANRANRANQLNPNHAQYFESRGQPQPPKKDKQAHAQNKARAGKHANNFGNRAGALKPRDKVHEQSLKTFRSVLQGVCGSSAHFVKNGSRRKGTAIPGSDFDYHTKTLRRISIDERDQIVANSTARGLKIAVGKAFTVHPPGGPSIDFFPPNAEWHDDVPVQAPRQPPMGNGCLNAIKKLKDWVKQKKIDMASYRIEELVKEIQVKKGFNEKTDPSGEKRFSEAQRRIRTA